MNLGPRCPECRARIPLKRTQWKLGKAFACDTCGTALVIPKQYYFTLAAIAGWYAVKPDSGSVWLHVATLAPFLAGAALYSVTLKPRRISPASPR